MRVFINNGTRYCLRDPTNIDQLLERITSRPKCASEWTLSNADACSLATTLTFTVTEPRVCSNTAQTWMLPTSLQPRLVHGHRFIFASAHRNALDRQSSNKLNAFQAFLSYLLLHDPFHLSFACMYYLYRRIAWTPPCFEYCIYWYWMLPTESSCN